MSQTDRRHATITVALHWTIALLVVALLAIGWSMTRQAPGSNVQFALYQLHKSLGILVLVLTLLRVGWRIVQPPPAPPRPLPRWSRVTARIVQAAILALTLVVPLLGWALVSTSRLAIPTVLFGILPWPGLPGLETLSPATRAGLEPQLAAAHAFLAVALAALAGLHASAALYHHAVRRDDVLWRMLPLAVLRRR